jgi:hypothetical protein
VGQRPHDFRTGRITIGMHDTSVTVGSLATELKLSRRHVKAAAQTA